jgi:hypothetical protein
VFEVGHFVPEVALAEHVAVVAAEDDDRVVVEAAGGYCFQEFADAVVDVGNGAVVGAARTLDLGGGEGFVPEVADFEEAG